MIQSDIHLIFDAKVRELKSRSTEENKWMRRSQRNKLIKTLHFVQLH